jgi:predicted cupin superfamily sugar epimerase
VQSRVHFLIGLMELQPHSSGGLFREIGLPRPGSRTGYSSPVNATLAVEYCLLQANERLAWHRMDHETPWQYHEGDVAELAWIDPMSEQYDSSVLGPANEKCLPVQIVPAHCWQSLWCRGVYTLLSRTSVRGAGQPEMLSGLRHEAGRLKGLFPELDQSNPFIV